MIVLLQQIVTDSEIEGPVERQQQRILAREDTVTGDDAPRQPTQEKQECRGEKQKDRSRLMGWGKTVGPIEISETEDGKGDAGASGPLTQIRNRQTCRHERETRERVRRNLLRPDGNHCRRR